MSRRTVAIDYRWTRCFFICQTYEECRFHRTCHFPVDSRRRCSSSRTISPNKLPLSKRTAKPRERCRNFLIKPVPLLSKFLQRGLADVSWIQSDYRRIVKKLFIGRIALNNKYLIKVSFYHNTRIMRLTRNICEAIFHLY